MKYATEIKDDEYKLNVFGKSYETSVMSHTIVKQYDAVELVDRIKDIESMFTLTYGPIENFYTKITLEYKRKMESKDFFGENALDDLLAYSNEGKKERKRKVVNFNMKYSAGENHFEITNSVYQRSTISTMTGMVDWVLTGVAGMAVSTVFPPAMLIASAGMVAMLCDDTNRDLKHNRPSGIWINMLPKEICDPKTAIKYNALCTLLEEYKPAKSENTLKKLETEITRINNITPAELKRRKSLEELKGTIEKTGKGNKRKNIIKQFR